MSASPFAPLALLLALAACASSPPPLHAVPSEPEAPGVTACREEARRDAATRDTFRQLNPANPANQARIATERRDVEEQAFRDCLRRNGIAGGGGVERVQPRR